MLLVTVSQCHSDTLGDGKLIKNFSDERLLSDLLGVFVKHGILPDKIWRNVQIRLEYKELIADGVKGIDAQRSLAEKYFLGEKTVNSIIYQTGLYKPSND